MLLCAFYEIFSASISHITTLHVFLYHDFLYGKNDFAERFKIFLDIDLKIILLYH